MFALATDLFLILLLGVTTGVTISLNDSRIRAQVFKTFETVLLYVASSHPTQIKGLILAGTKAITHISNTIVSCINLFTGNVAEKKQKTIIHGKYITVNITHNNKECTLYLPYNSREAREFKKCFFITNGERKEIAHPCGVPILVSNNDVGVDSIEFAEEEEMSL